MFYTETHTDRFNRPVIFSKRNGNVLVVKYQYKFSSRYAVGYEKLNEFAVIMTDDLKHEISRHNLPCGFAINDLLQYANLM